MSISHYSNKYERTEWGIHTNSPTADLNITNDATIGGTIQVTTVANDDTENRLLVLNTADNVFEYRDATTILNNPFDQDLNTFDPVEFDQVNINDNFLLSTFNDSFTRFHQTPLVTNNDKVFEFQTDTDTGAARIDLNNAGNKSSGLKLQTKTTSDGNAFIQYETGTNRWFEGINKTNNEFAIHYSPGDPTDNLYNAANERLSLSNTGDLTTLGSVNADALILQNVVNDDAETKLMTWDIVGKSCKFRNVSSLPIGNPFDQTLNQADPVDFLSVDINNNTLINSNSDSLSSFTQTPAITTGYKQFAFTSDTSDSPVVVEVINADLTAAAHTGILLHNPSLGGGNQFIIYETPGEKEWTVGRQRTSDTFKWNNAISDSDDFLTVDANTKMSLSNTGALGLNTDNIIISASTDSFAGFAQLPAVTTGDKIFQFSSQTSDAESRLEIVNSTSNVSAHACLAANTQLSGGNMFTKYLRIGFAQWNSGYQSSTNTFRWNYDGTGTDNLTDDSKTRMHLSNTGDLTLNGTASINGDYVTAALGQLQIQDAGEMQQNFIFDAETIPSTQIRTASHTDQSISFNTGVNGGLWKSASADGNALINHTAGGVITFYTNASTVTGNTIPWVSSLRITPTVVNSLLPIQKQDNVVQHDTIGPSLFTITLTATQYDWTSTNGALSMYSAGPNFAINATTGEATLSGWIAASCHAKVSMSCGLRLKAGTNETFIIRCVGNVVAGVASSQFGAIEITLKNATDFQTVSFESLVIVANTGYYKFTIENTTGTNNVDISYARAILVL